MEFEREIDEINQRLSAMDDLAISTEEEIAKKVSYSDLKGEIEKITSELKKTKTSATRLIIKETGELDKEALMEIVEKFSEIDADMTQIKTQPD